MGATTAPRLQDGRFLLLETLGRGGMASVYRAFDRVDQRMVALKVQLDREPAGPRHAFAAEFDTWSRLTHPNVVGALELLRSRSGPLPAGSPYLVLEHVRGGPAHRVLRPGRERPETWQRFARDVLRGLSHIHGAGYLHRDLKPANILVGHGRGARRSVKLTDFGLATPLGTADEPGCISGSLPYLSPEALCGRTLDERADLYGLGVLMYQLTTGRLPISGADPDAWIRWHLSGPPLDPRDERCGPRLARFIRRLTARPREDRPDDARAAMTLLGASVPEPTGSTAACSPADRARVRLALDAVRLGAVRVFPLPTKRSCRDTILAEARVAAQVLGLDWQALGSGTTAHRELERVALALIHGRRDRAPAAIVRRFSLTETLALELVGDEPILARTARRTIACGSRAGTSLASFFLDCARRRPLALAVTRDARSADPQVAALCRELERAAETADRPRRGRGGLLLLSC